MNNRLLETFNEVESYHWWFVGRRFLLKRILEEKGIKKPVKILDIGCGTGGSIPFLSKYGDIYGVDSSEKAVQYCKGNGYKRTSRAKAEKLPFKNNSFDLIVLLDVLEHIKNDKKALKEAKRVLKKEGSIIITAPASPFIWSKHDEMQGHFRRYTKSDLVNLAEKESLQITKISYFNTFLFLPIGVIRKLSILKPFNRLGNYDSKLNFDIAKISILNRLLLSIFKAELYLTRWFSYPFGVSVVAVVSKSN